MTRDPERPAEITQEDWNSVDVPEATDQAFAAARPFSEVHPDLFAAWKRAQGRAEIKEKVAFSLRLSPDVVDAVKASGTGYDDRVEAILRDAIARGALSEP